VGVDNFTASVYSSSLSLHTGDSASLTTAGVETDPPGHLVWGGGLSKQLGVQPPAIQTPEVGSGVNVGGGENP
jgi:hypothetical protein